MLSLHTHLSRRTQDEAGGKAEEELDNDDVNGDESAQKYGQMLPVQCDDLQVVFHRRSEMTSSSSCSPPPLRCCRQCPFHFPLRPVFCLLFLRESASLHPANDCTTPLASPHLTASSSVPPSVPLSPLWHESANVPPPSAVASTSSPHPAAFLSFTSSSPPLPPPPPSPSPSCSSVPAPVLSMLDNFAVGKCIDSSPILLITSSSPSSSSASSFLSAQPTAVPSPPCERVVFGCHDHFVYCLHVPHPRRPRSSRQQQQQQHHHHHHHHHHHSTKRQRPDKFLPPCEPSSPSSSLAIASPDSMLSSSSSSSYRVDDSSSMRHDHDQTASSSPSFAAAFSTSMPLSSSSSSHTFDDSSSMHDDDDDGHTAPPPSSTSAADGLTLCWRTRLADRIECSPAASPWARLLAIGQQHDPCHSFIHPSILHLA